MRRWKALLLTLTLAALLAGAARAEIIGGEGWFEDDYAGSWENIPGTDLRIKVPDGWYDNSYDDLYDETFEDDSIIRSRPDDGMYLTASWEDEDFNGAVREMEQESRDGIYTETASLILKGDRDWYIGATENYMVAVTGYGRGIVRVVVVMNDTAPDHAAARRIVSSVG